MQGNTELDIRKILEELFLREKPTKILITLKNSQSAYATSVAKAVDCTYSHTTKVLDQLKDLGLVEFDKQGRVKKVKLTAEGEEIAHDLEGLTKRFLRMRDKITNMKIKLDDEEPEEVVEANESSSEETVEKQEN